MLTIHVLPFLSELLQEFHQHLNSIEPSIQFTCEVEENGQLLFLFYYQKKMTVVSQQWLQEAHTH